MRVFGNLTNRIGENVTSPEPKIGMGATIFAWSDRHPATVTGISATGKTIELTEDMSVRVDKNGMSESQSYKFLPNENGRRYKARKDKKGRWRVIGSKNGVALGYRDSYYDYSF